MINHGVCGKTWTGGQVSHCGRCHETFSSVTGFDKHQKGLTCVDPALVGLVVKEKSFGTVWFFPGTVVDDGCETVLY